MIKFELNTLQASFNA